MGVPARARDHRIPALPGHYAGPHDRRVATPLGLYAIRIRGRLGETALSAFPSMAAELKRGETVLTGVLEDRAALFGVIAQIEALDLELLEVRRVPAGPGSQEPRDARLRDGLWG